jgi:hypothetical protein
MYVPDPHVQGFPSDLPGLIAHWNGMFAANYFECRAILAEIARRSNARVAGAQLLEFSSGTMPSEGFCFFHDDDDIFDHDLASRLPEPGDFDVVVFPLFRFHSDLFTFVHRYGSSDALLGRREHFHFRYQTNNYGVLGDRVCRGWFGGMKDHVGASEFADRNGLMDHLVSRPMAATFKTVWSASTLPLVTGGRKSVVAEMEGLIRSLDTPIPSGYEWLEKSTAKLRLLVGGVLSGASDLRSLVFG